MCHKTPQPFFKGDFLNYSGKIVKKLPFIYVTISENNFLYQQVGGLSQCQLTRFARDGNIKKEEIEFII